METESCSEHVLKSKFSDVENSISEMKLSCQSYEEVLQSKIKSLEDALQMLKEKNVNLNKFVCCLMRANECVFLTFHFLQNSITKGCEGSSQNLNKDENMLLRRILEMEDRHVFIKITLKKYNDDDADNSIENKQNLDTVKNYSNYESNTKRI